MYLKTAQNCFVTLYGGPFSLHLEFLVSMLDDILLKRSNFDENSHVKNYLQGSFFFSRIWGRQIIC